MFIQKAINVPVVHKQTRLYLSTWNGNFLCSPSGRILHCYYKDGLTQESEEKRHMFNFQERKRKGASISSEHIWISYHIFVCSMNYDFCYTFEKYLNLHSFSFLYNCDLTSVILFCCTRSFSIQDHIYFLASQKSNSFKSNSFHLFHVSVQYTEPGIGWICICWWYKYRNQFFLRTDTAQRQITKIVYLKMSAIICSMFAYWIYNLLGYFLKPTLNTVVAE